MSSSREGSLAIVGTVVDSLPDWTLRVRDNCILVTNDQGIIVFVDEASEANLAMVKEKYSLEECQIIRLENKEEFLIPGFIDTHIHAPQFPNNGLGQDMGLLDWLQRYTFPMEKSIANDDVKALDAYERVVQTTLAWGTTSAAYYATIGRRTTEILCDVAEKFGQRALVGKVCMNRNAYDGYQETTRDSLEETEKFIVSTLARKSRLVAPIVTPRFVPSCDEELLVGLGDLVKKYEPEGLRVQTHLSECLPEMLWVRELEPWAKNYTEIYDKAGLLTDKTILAHAIHLDDDELQRIRDAGAGLSHCPNSNCSLGAGSFDIVRAKRSGVKVGLGTDCSGGYAPSIVDAMRFAIATANFLHIRHAKEAFENGQGPMLQNIFAVIKFSPQLDFRGALFLATRGSAQVAGLDSVCGHFDVGMKLDALRISMTQQDCRSSTGVRNRVTELYGHETLEDVVQKFVQVGDDRNIVQVFVDGRLVKNLI